MAADCWMKKKKINGIKKKKNANTKDVQHKMKLLITAVCNSEHAVLARYSVATLIKSVSTSDI